MDGGPRRVPRIARIWGTMVSGRDNSSEWSNTGDSATQAASSQDKLNEAVTELRRLTDAKLLQSMEHLCDVDGISADESPSVESVRGFLLWSAGCLRLAGELEAAARCCQAHRTRIASAD